MLTHITVRNFAIVDSLELDIQSGLTALTGETGAGKSILLDAIGLVMGDRADSGTVRHGTNKAEINACFDLSKLPLVHEWMDELELVDDDECIVRRVVSADGRSKAFINGRPVSLQQLRELGEQLVDIHGQHEHQSLMKRPVQLQIVDNYGQLTEPTQQLATLYRQWKAHSDRLEQLVNHRDEADARRDLLSFQVNELNQLDLHADEYQELTREHELLAHMEETVAACQQAHQILDESETGHVTEMLNQTINLLEKPASMDEHLSPVIDMLNSALIQAQEASSTIRDFVDRLEGDPGRLNWLEERLHAIHDLARKHRCNPEDLIALRTELEEELSQLTNSDATIDELKSTCEKLESDYRKLAGKISQQRQKSGKQLSEKITGLMQTLGMKGGKFHIAIDTNPDAPPAPKGLDTIEFQVTANAGQPLRPLAKVASGGELARISLALQVAAAGSTRIPTLIFDEVDSGIGGGIAEIVGQQLRTLGDNSQVLCVTHLPQVASQAHHHCQVSKQTQGEQTFTQIIPIKESERISEIARMLGGVEITENTLAHAQEMIDRAAG